MASRDDDCPRPQPRRPPAPLDQVRPPPLMPPSMDALLAAAAALLARAVLYVAAWMKKMAVERSEEGGAAPDAETAEETAPPAVSLELEHGEHHDSTLYRFEKGTYVYFTPGSSLFGKKVFLYTNYVVTENDDEKAEQPEFVRNQYYGLEWRRSAAAGGAGGAGGAEEAESEPEEEALGAGALVTDTELFCRLRLTRAGCFHYYFVYDSAASAVGPQGSGWLQVAPTLRVGPGGGERLPLDAVCCQTVLAKCLGPLPRWLPALRAAPEAGYNALHFTPVQELGASRSSYSIADQLKLNPAFSAGAGREATFADVENIVSKIRTEWKMLSICDVVLNHTADESPWLAEVPGAAYNCDNSPHLRPAAALDAQLARLGGAVARGDHRARGVPARLTEPHHLQALQHLLETQTVPELRLHEMFCCDVDRLVQDFYCLARNKVPAVRATAAGEGPAGEGPAGEGPAGELRLLTDPQYRRLHATVDMDRALQLYNVYRPECFDEDSRLKRCCEELRRRLVELNAAAEDLVRGHLQAAVHNCVAAVRYHRIQSDGPRIQEVSAKNPLVPRYFTWIGGAPAASEAEAALYDARAARCAAHNGWVMGGDPLLDFASDQEGRVYLRRELIAWGDSVKLRYGAAPAACPALWARMRDYVELCAELHDGLRLDNCHSTPLHVAEYMLDCARNVKPDLYVVAELFTDSDLVDNIYVNRLGITSLIREAQAAWDAREQGRLVHRFGGRPVGSLRAAAPGGPRAAPGGPRTARLPPRAAPAVAHALFMDVTHDNPSHVQKRSVFDVLPTAALVSMACCATGSSRGYDELVPHHIHVVDEERLYPEWGASGAGATAARRDLNRLHADLAAAGYTEVYVDQLDERAAAVTRHRPATRQSVILVAVTAFSPPEPAEGPHHLAPLRFEGELEEILFEMDLRHVEHKTGGSPLRAPGEFQKHARHINGLDEYEVCVRRSVPLQASQVFSAARADGSCTVLDIKPLLPGTVAAIAVRPRAAHAAALREVSAALRGRGAADADPLRLADLLRPLALPDLNALLYCCDAEERDAGAGGVYDVPGHGPLVYAGLQGVESLLSEVCAADDLGHAVCANLRAGDWLLEYQWRRLEARPRLAAVAARYRELLRPLAALPRYLVPALAAAALRALYQTVSAAALRAVRAARLGAVRRGLALTAVQLSAAPPSAALPAPPAPPAADRPVASLSAGLPHFAVGYMRCWGRDTFIALRGLYLLTGRYQEARDHILSFAACLRHGLIPNLLDGGRSARYNCRDAVWWWLLAAQQYCRAAPEGPALLAAPVLRLYPTDDCEPAAAPAPLHDVIQEALDVHFQGLVFRERNAGRAIDAHMTDKGFNVQIGIDPETGFPFGGNDANCGTWMDKMGSSEAAGNRGAPATPRDGSAVELAALAHSAAAWLAELHRAGRYPHAGLARRHRDGTVTRWAWSQWAQRLRAHFERCFWVAAEPAAAEPRPDLVHRRGVYKDTYGATRAYADYQLRCNFVVAMAIAPDLFDPKRAWLALDRAEELLLGPLGMKTLDPADWAYRGDYDNADDGRDPSVAHGFNYHQGPEWVWPLGYYVRARLAFAHENGKLARTVAAAYAALGPAARELRDSPWRGLPELTNAGGASCAHSCRTQAWSSASAAEALDALEAARRARPLLD